VSTCHFRAVPAQARPKMRAVPCSPPCRDSGHGTALLFVSCRHGPKYFVPCRASGRAKRPCHNPPSNDTAQVPALTACMRSCRPSSRGCRTSETSPTLTTCPLAPALWIGRALHGGRLQLPLPCWSTTWLCLLKARAVTVMIAKVPSGQRHLLKIFPQSEGCHRGSHKN
jgi:hypothetical protein